YEVMPPGSDVQLRLVNATCSGVAPAVTSALKFGNSTLAGVKPTSTTAPNDDCTVPVGAVSLARLNTRDAATPAARASSGVVEAPLNTLGGTAMSIIRSPAAGSYRNGAIGRSTWKMPGVSGVVIGTGGVGSTVTGPA